MAAFFHIHLEEIPQIVHRRRRQSEMTLLLDRGWLGVALRYDDTSQVRSILTGDLLPHRLAFVGAEGNLPIGHLWIQEDAPPILGHLYVAESGPSRLVHARRRAQIAVVLVRALGPHVGPPVEKFRLPVLERPL